jgi:TRAP transporter TAXI family solute receptor
MRPIPSRRGIRLTCVGIVVLGFVTLFVRPVFPQDGARNCNQLDRKDGPRLATGPADSSYFRFARMLKEVSGPTQERLQVCVTEGSEENLELLNQNRVEFAIAQGDVMHKGWSGELPVKGTGDGLRHVNFHNLLLVRRLFSEKLQIVTGPHTYISTVAELKSKHVWMGPSKSGTFSTAREVLQAAGVEGAVTNDPGVRNYGQAEKAILNEDLDAFFRVTTVPVDSEREQDDPSDDASKASLTYLFKNNAEVHLLNLDAPLIDRILQSPAYVQVPVYRNSYPGQKNGVMTIGLEAMLITRIAEAGGDSPGDDEVRSLNAAITDGRGEIAKRTNIDLDLVNAKLDPHGQSEERSLAAHAHPAAQRDITVNPKARYYVGASVALLFMILVLLSLRSKTALETIGGNTKYIVSAGLLVAACALFGVALWYYEGRFSFGFHNPLVAAQSLLVYFARGLKTDALMTQQGQLIALLALAVIATLVHSINSEALGEGVNKSSKKMASWFFKRAAALRPNERHLVILNWDQRASERMAEWIKDPLNKRSKIIVVSPDITPVPGIAQSSGIEILHGDPKNLDILEKARVQDAKLVLICPAWRRMGPRDRRSTMDVEMADNYTIRTIYGIRMHECRSHSKRSVAIDAEIYLESNWREAKNAGGPEAQVNAAQNGFRGYVIGPQGSVGQASAAAPN